MSLGSRGTILGLTAFLAATLFVRPVAGAPAPVRVLYAGSLVSLVENALGPAFARSTGAAVQGRAGGSVALAHMILDRLTPADVFISADPDVNKLLMAPGRPPSAAWFLTFARTAMVIAYNPRSRFAPALARAAAGGQPWFRVLESPGFRLGRTDPRLDPKGYRTLMMFQLAGRYYGVPGLGAAVLGAPENPRQIFPEEELVGRLEAGQLDAGVFYLIEAVEQHLPYVGLPDAINLGNLSMARAYAQAVYTTPKGRVLRGTPILYTVTIPSGAQNLGGAVRFVRFLFAPAGQTILRAHGLLTVPPLVGGDPRAVPRELRPLVRGGYGG